MFVRSLVPPMLATILVVVGCGGPSAPPPPTPTPVPEVSGTVEDVVPPDLATGVVPASLDRMQEKADQLFVAVPAKDWARVHELVASIEDAWHEWLGTSDAQRVPEDLKDGVDLRLQDLKDSETKELEAPILRAANNLQMAILYVVEVYRPALPTSVGRLQVAERNILLDVASGDTLAASETLAGAEALWQELEVRVRDAGGDQVADQLSAVLDRQQKAADNGDADALKKGAEEAQDLIDRIQALFT